MISKLIVTGTMLSLIAVSTPIGGNGGQWAQWGLAGLVVGFTLWRDMDREKRLSMALNQSHFWVQETLVEALKKNTAVLDKVSDSLDLESD